MYYALHIMIIAWLLSWFPTLISSLFLVTFLAKLINWINLTFFSTSRLDLKGYGAGNRHSWAVITGASDGIGAAFAKELAAQRFNLFLVGRNPEKLDRVRNEILSTNEGLKVVNLISEASDASHENISSLFREIESILEQQPQSSNKNSLRILINNVGMGQNGKRRLGDISVKEEGGLFEKIVQVNCIYPILLTRAFLKALKMNSNERVAIFNIASCAALTPATPFSSLYAATKAFNRSFSISLSGEMVAKRLLHPERCAPVDVICVNPGFVATNMTKMTESLYCCTASQHSRIVFSKITSSPVGVIDIIPHWKHSLMWSILAFLEVLIPSEWLLVAIVMPAILKFSGKYRNFQIKQE